MGLYEEMWTKEGSIQARENEIRRISLEEGRAEGLAEGLAEGFAEGEAKGEAKGKDMMHKAMSMLIAKEPEEKIAQCSGLSLEEVLELKDLIRSS